VRKYSFIVSTVSILLLAIFYSFNSTNNVRATAAIELLQTTPIMVTTTADSGDGSLRTAINASNAITTGSPSIQFNIPAEQAVNGVFTIKVLTALPALQRDGTSIDGTTQTTATGNTNTAGPEIVLDGSSSTAGSNGIVISASNTTIRGLTINNFATGAGILITDASKNTTVAGNFIGTNPSGTNLASNQTGVRINSGSDMNTIGGSAANANVISGNSIDGVVITGTSTDGNTVASNFIGVDASSSRNPLPNFGNGVTISAGAKANVIGGGTAALGNIIGGNLGSGVLITGDATSGNLVQRNSIGSGVGANDARANGGSGIAILDGSDANTIGGVDVGNTIAFNVGNGITVGGGTNSNLTIRNRISRNSIFLNGALGIDLGNDGVTNNDAGDTDSGPNLLMNFPVFTSVTSLAGTVTVTGTIDTPSPSTVTIEIFTNNSPSPGADSSGFGEGQTFVTAVTPSSSGAFTASFTAGPNVAITATATDANGNTSEFSSAFVLGAGMPDLTVLNLAVAPTSVNAGNMVRVTFAVSNSGTVSAPASRVTVVLSNDNIITAQDTVLTSVMTGALSPGASQSFQVDITAPVPPQGSTGPFFIGVIVDSDNSVTEASETNNTANATINIISMADLTVQNLTVNRATASPGDTVRVSFTIANQGSFNAIAHMEDVRLSTDNVINATDTLLTTVTSSGITAGSTAQFILDITIPNNTNPGSFFVGVLADARNNVPETNENNNSASVAISVSGDIDLELTNLTVTPNTGAPGAQVAVTVRLTNRGTLSAPATSVEFRLSNDQIINNADTLLGTVMSTVLGPGQNATISFSATIPTGISPGSRFIGAIVDPAGNVMESNETNNTASSAFAIVDQNAPAVTVMSPNGGEAVISGDTFMIRWTSTDNVGVVSQDILLSVDGGATFNQVIVTGLAGTANSFVWNVPAGLNTSTARVRVVARDASGNMGSDTSDNNFTIGVRPILISPTFSSGKLKFVAAGSNIVPGAMLIVVNGSSRESFITGMNSSGSRFIVKKSTRSTPSNLTLRDAIPSGVTVQLIVQNPNGIASAPISFQR
jgi:uncharacterized membrane protein